MYYSGVLKTGGMEMNMGVYAYCPGSLSPHPFSGAIATDNQGVPSHHRDKDLPTDAPHYTERK